MSSRCTVTRWQAAVAGLSTAVAPSAPLWRRVGSGGVEWRRFSGGSNRASDDGPMCRTIINLISWVVLSRHGVATADREELPGDLTRDGGGGQEKPRVGHVHRQPRP